MVKRQTNKIDMENKNKIDRIMKDSILEEAWDNENKKKVMLSLSPTIKKEVNNLLKPTGGKLSPLVDSLLVSWIYHQRLMKKLLNEIEIDNDIFGHKMNKKGETKGEDQGNGWDQDGEVIPADAVEIKDDFKKNGGSDINIHKE